MSRPYHRNKPQLLCKEEDLPVNPLDPAKISYRVAPAEKTVNKACEHLDLFFADGQFTIVCFNCRQEWRGIRRTKDQVFQDYTMGSLPTPEGLRSNKKSSRGSCAHCSKTH